MFSSASKTFRGFFVSIKGAVLANEDSSRIKNLAPLFASAWPRETRWSLGIVGYEGIICECDLSRIIVGEEEVVCGDADACLWFVTEYRRLCLLKLTMPVKTAPPGKG